MIRMHTGRKVAIAAGAATAGVIFLTIFHWKDLQVKYFELKLRSEDARQRRAAVKSLERLGHRSVPGLLLALRSDDSTVQRLAAMAIAAIQPQEKATIESLIALLNAERADVRAAAAMAVGRFGHQAKGAVPGLLRATLDPDSKVRASANLALCAIEPAEADAIPAFKTGSK
jgi:HEAT repeat protein